MTEEEKQKLILDMCYTYRHDFGLNRDPKDPPWVAGMTDIERKGLLSTMTQIFNNNIEPLLMNQSKPKSTDEAISMLNMATEFFSEKKNDKHANC